MNVNLMILFTGEYRKKIEMGLPKLFQIANMECTRGGKVGMEVGNLRERIITALLLLAYGKENVKIPSTTSHEIDVTLAGIPISIKTKTNKGFSGVKLMWASDRAVVDNFCSKYLPTSAIIYVNIVWNDIGSFSFIPLEVQRGVLLDLADSYIKKPSKKTNSRGPEISADALKKLLKDKRTLTMPIFWKHEESIADEHEVYVKWIDKWKEL